MGLTELSDILSVAIDHTRKFNDPCEWNPDKNRACYFDEAHAEADFIVGANGQWRLCKKCAALPKFKRFKKTKIRHSKKG